MTPDDLLKSDGCSLKGHGIYFSIGGFTGSTTEIVGDGVNLFYREHLRGDWIGLSPSQTKWKNFWQRCDQEKIWQWRKHYEADCMICDGTQWSLTLSIEGKRLVSDGSNSYPGGQDHFSATPYGLPMEKLIGSLKLLMEDVRRKCPACGSRHIGRYFYGFPALDQKLQDKLEKETVVLGGCEIPGQWDFHCNQCQYDWYLPQF